MHARKESISIYSINQQRKNRKETNPCLFLQVVYTTTTFSSAVSQSKLWYWCLLLQLYNYYCYYYYYYYYCYYRHLSVIPRLPKLI